MQQADPTKKRNSMMTRQNVCEPQLEMTELSSWVTILQEFAEFAKGRP